MTSNCNIDKSKILFSNLTREYWFNKNEYYSFKNIQKFIKYFLSFIDSRTKNTFKIYSLQDLNIDKNKNNLNIMLSVENCNFWNFYEFINKFGNFGNKNIDIYIYNHYMLVF